MANTTAKTTPAQRTAEQPLLKVNLAHTKETKGAHRYDAPDSEAERIGGPLNLYIRKDSMKEFPPNVTLVITQLQA